MSTVKNVYEFIDKMAPFKLAEKWDNCGLIVGDFDNNVTKCMFALDITQKIIDIALEKKCELIITHHPVIFNPIKKIKSDSLVYQLIKNNISVISAHTNLDKVDKGTSQILAEKLKLTNIKTIDNTNQEKYYKIIVFVPTQSVTEISSAMTSKGAGSLGNYSECAFTTEGIGCFKPNKNASPRIGTTDKLEFVKEIKLEMICSENDLSQVIEAMKNAHPYETVAYDIFENKAITQNYGFCKLGELDKNMSSDEFASYVKIQLGLSHAKYCSGKNDIKKVAVVAGGGGSIIQTAVNAKADAFITGDIKHDMFVTALEKKITLIDIGHYESEIIVFTEMIDYFKYHFKDIHFEILDEHYRPIKYIFDRG